MFAWVALADTSTDTFDSSGYGTPEWEGQAQTGNQQTADLVIPLGVLLFVLPVLILFGTSTRLGSAQRDQRMAAMRLVGATPGEVRLVSAAEAGAIGAIGVLGGLALFALLRPLVGVLPWRPGVFPADLARTAGPGRGWPWPCRCWGCRPATCPNAGWSPARWA